MLADLATDPSLTLQLSIGVVGFRGGVVTLTVHGDGRATVVRRSTRGEERAQAALDADERAELGRELDAAGLLDLRAHPGGREPDDVPVDVVVARDGRPLHEAKLWYGDRYEDPGLDQVIRRFDALVGEVTR